MNHIRNLAVFTMGLAVLLCCSVDSSAQNTTTPSQSDKKFVQSAMAGGNAEVALGKLAVQKASGTDIKQFGQKMIDDYTKLENEIRDVAHEEGIRASAGITGKDKAFVAKAKVLSGVAFERAYIEAMVKDHRQNLDEFNKEANRGNDTAIKDAASRGALVIGEHLKLAEQIARSHNLRAGQ